jgi:ectoine hydrolase
MTVLEPNVCFHMIAVMQFGDWGVEASEAIRVTETGSELFCNMSKELHISNKLLDYQSNKCFKVVWLTINS